MSGSGKLSRNSNYAAEQVEAMRIKTKACSKCGDRLPVDEFDIDNSKEDGRKTWCKACRSTNALERQNRAIAKNSDAMQELFDRIDGESLLALSNASPGGVNLPHRVQVLEEIVALLGGVKGLAMHYVATFNAAAQGSAIRQRMLDKLLTAIHLASEGGGVSKPREEMSDEELAAAAREHALRIAKDTVEGDARETA